MDPETTLRGLRAAVATSPENAPLLRHLAETLAAYGRHAEAEVEWKALLKLTPNDADARIQLARVYRVQGKNSAAHVVLDDLVAGGNPRARVERARLLLAEGEVESAVRDYKKAIAEDATVADPALADQLGIADADEYDDGDDDREVVDGRMRHGEGSAGAGPQPIRSDVKFVHVGGMTKLKEEIRKKIVLPMQRPDLYKAYGKKSGGGILMYGPPGCGKTFLARATAGEVDARFLAIGIHDVLDMWVGNSERNLHGIFESARAHKPCVLFFDEVDALGSNRADMKHHGARNTVNQFLAELDGMNGDNEGVLVLAATNAPWQVDSAFRRPGRFDRVIFVPPPDEEARAEVLRLVMAGKPQKDVDFAAVAKKTDRCSGADLRAIVDRAVEEKLDAAVRTGTIEPLTTKDLLAAAKAQKPTTAEWFASAKNYVLYANESGIYDELKTWLKL